MIDTDQHIEIASPTDSDSRDPVILLLLQNSQDRRLFNEHLPDEFTVISGEKSLEAGEFDLCIVDDQSSRLHRETLQSLKEQAKPVLLPVLLVSNDQDVIQKNPDTFEFADDVVYIPASTKLLRSRINIFLRQRRYSLQLSEEKRKYKLITENATDMISRHIPDGTYRYVSPASEELTGYTPEELEGKNLFDMMHPSDREVFENMADPFGDKEVVTYSFRKKVKDGSYRWVETTMRRILDEQTGEVSELQASTRDISTREKLDKKLKEEKEYIYKAIENLNELFYMVDEDRNFINWTNIKKKLGYTDQEIRQMHPLELFREEDHDFITSKMEEAFDTGSAEVDMQMKGKSGQLTSYFITMNRLKRGDEKFLVGTCINLADIKEAEYDLKQQQQLFNAIINQTESVIFVKDEDRQYKLVNDSFLRFFGKNREDVIGKTDREIFGQEVCPKEDDLAVTEEGKTLKTDEKVPNDNGYEYFHTIKYPLKNVNGFEDCLCGVSTNITDLKQASEQLEERIKEQQCLYNISSLSEKTTTVEELLKQAVTYLPEGWQYPEITEAAITFGDNVYKTEGYRDTEWKLSVENNAIEERPLKIDVVYTGAKENADHDVFSKEERKLLDSIIETLSSQIERTYAQEKLQKSKKRWSDLVKNDPNLIQILEPDGTIQFINEAGAKMLGYKNPDQAIGENYFHLVESENDEDDISNKRTRKVLEGNKVESQTYKVQDINGKTLYLESEAVPTTLEDGRIGLQQVAKDVTEREKYERELKESLDEKKTLLQEIHHRVKNNLAVVSGMMDLQTLSTENEEARSLLADSKNRIQTMALIHDKLYESDSLSEIEFGTYVKDLLEFVGDVNSVSDDIELDLEYDTFYLNINQAIPCALIINELVANAYEHAFADQAGGSINVLLQQNEDAITIHVRDNGSGLPDNYMDQKKDDSIGFSIVNTLIKQLQAEKNVESDNGLAFSLSFKKENIKGSASSLVE